MSSINKERLINTTLDLISKHSVTAYEIEKNTSLSAVGVQKIIDRTSKNPQERTLNTIISYITKRYESDFDIIPVNEPVNPYKKESLSKEEIDFVKEAIRDNWSDLSQDEDFRLVFTLRASQWVKRILKN